MRAMGSQMCIYLAIWRLGMETPTLRPSAFPGPTLIASESIIQASQRKPDFSKLDAFSLVPFTLCLFP